MRAITARDKLLLQKLGDFGVLSTAQIQALHFRETRKTTMLRRLRRLEELGALRRLRGLPDGSHGWCLTPAYAKSQGLVAIGRRLNRHTLEHDVTLSEVRLALERVGLGAGWAPEHVLRHKAWQTRKPGAPNPENIPDGVFSAEAHGKFVAIAVELELNAKSTERYRKTLLAYWWRRNIGMIWYLVPHVALGQKLDRVWKRVTEGGTDRRLRWSLLDDVLNRPFETQLRNLYGSVLLRDVFTMKAPAHGVAHPMSRPNGEIPSHST